MEKIPNKLYPERAFSGVGEKVENLQRIISGEVPTWEISESERSEILKIESELAENLESIYSITPNNIDFDFNYLLTPEGVADFSKVVGFEIPTDVKSLADLKTFLYQHTEELAVADKKELAALGGRSSIYRKKEIFKAVSKTINDKGEINTEVIPESESVNIRLNPILDYEKTNNLRALKADIKLKRVELERSGQSQDYVAVLDGIFDLYQQKINEMIANRADVFLSLRKKAEFLGEDSLTEDERLALGEDMTSANISSGLSRYDKFLYGAGSDFDDSGWSKQISQELIELADIEEQKNLIAQQEMNHGIKEKGLNKEKLLALNVEVEEVERLCKETLEHYGLLSAVPASEYAPDRPGPAADNKWQFIISDSYPNLSVLGKQKIIRCPNKPQSISKLLSVTIAHEIEGHVNQHNNRSKIPLKLFEKIGSDRSAIFAEAGAMSNQALVTENAFGYQTLSLPQYIRAMVTKLNGGNYGDCVKAYYLSKINDSKYQLEQGEIDTETFKKDCAKKLKIAINATSRLFNGSTNNTEINNHLIRSKDTVYLEQVKLAEELKKKGFDQMLNLTGINFSALEFLLRAKLIDINDIKSPDFYSLQMWERIKSEYEEA